METPRRTRKRQIQVAVQEAIRKVQQAGQHQSELAGDPKRLDHHVNIAKPIQTVETCIAPDTSQIIESSDDGIGVGFIYTDNEHSSKRLDLGRWATKHNITHVALRDLLQLPKNWSPEDNFPVDPRTLLGTPGRTV